MTPRLIVCACIIYCDGQPVARFRSTLAACLELSALGWRCVRRMGARLMFAPRNFPAMR